LPPALWAQLTPEQARRRGRQLPSLGTLLPVVLFQLATPVLLPSAGAWVRLRNVLPYVVEGQLQARRGPRGSLRGRRAAPCCLSRVPPPMAARASWSGSAVAGHPEPGAAVRTSHPARRSLASAMCASGVASIAVRQHASVPLAHAFSCFIHTTRVAAQVLYTDRSKWSGALANHEALDHEAARRRDNRVSSAPPRPSAAARGLLRSQARPLKDARQAGRLMSSIGK